MALQSIPEDWVRDVVAALNGDPAKLQWTHTGKMRCQADFPAAFQYEVLEAFSAYLKASAPMGCPVTMESPSGETWEFYFVFKGQKTYGKIMLRDDRTRLVLFSAHLPTKTKLHCE